EVFGIAAGAAATMFFVTKIWDAINDPMIGFLSDRTRTSWGRFRPYLLWMAIPFAATGIATFYTPDLSDNGKLIYAYVTYTLVFMAYTAVNIPYGALMGVISPSSLERTTVSTFRFVLAFFGGLFVQLLTLPLIDYFGGSEFFGGSIETRLVDGVETNVVNKQVGFFWTVVVYATLAVILFWITFATTKERVQPEKEAENSSFSQDVADLIRNRPWIILLFVGLFQILAGWTRGSATAYYFNYFADIQDVDFFFNVASFGNFFAVGTVFSIAGMFLTRPLVRVFGNKWLLILVMLGNALCMAGFYVLGNSQWQLMYLLHAIGAFISGPMPILLWSMYADVADYSEWINHRRATGLVFAAATFSQKLGSALGAAVPGWALSYCNFVNPIDNVNQPQSQETINGIVSMMSILPAIFLGCGCVVMLFYNINASLLIQIESDLKARKKLSNE
ncbi:MAG: MFS transporter, partial [Planctomycetota bacterium]